MTSTAARAPVPGAPSIPSSRTSIIDRLNNRQPESFWPLHTRLEAEYEELIPLK
jgi:hypothetical protein